MRVAYTARYDWCQEHTQRNLIGESNIPWEIWLEQAAYPTLHIGAISIPGAIWLVRTTYATESYWWQRYRLRQLHCCYRLPCFCFQKLPLWGGKLWQVPRNCRKQNRTYLKINAHKGKNSRVWNFVQVLQLSILPSNADYHSGALILNIHPLKIVRFDPGAMYPAKSWLGKLGPKHIKIKVEQ